MKMRTVHCGTSVIHLPDYTVPTYKTTTWIFITVETSNLTMVKKVKVKLSRYTPGVAQTVGRGIALLFQDRGTRKGWLVSSTPRPHFTTGKDSVPIVQQARWAPGPVWTGGKSRPLRYLIPESPARSHSLYRLSYPAPASQCRYNIDTVTQKSSIIKKLYFPEHSRSDHKFSTCIYKSPGNSRRIDW